MDDIVIGSGCPCPCSLLESLRLNFRGGWPRPLRVQGLQQRHQRRQQQRHRAYHLAGEGQPIQGWEPKGKQCGCVVRDVFNFR